MLAGPTLAISQHDEPERLFWLFLILLHSDPKFRASVYHINLMKYINKYKRRKILKLSFNVPFRHLFYILFMNTTN